VLPLPEMVDDQIASDADHPIVEVPCVRPKSVQIAVYPEKDFLGEVLDFLPAPGVTIHQAADSPGI